MVDDKEIEATLEGYQESVRKAKEEAEAKKKGEKKDSENQDNEKQEDAAQ